MTAIEAVFSQPIVHRLGWALLHFVWKGAVVIPTLVGLAISVPLAAGAGAAEGVSAGTDAGGEVPCPSFDRIDYANPAAYLRLGPSLGSASRIKKVAATLEGKDPEQKVLSIHRWIRSHLRYDRNAPYRWRNFDDIVDSGVYGGCAEHSVVFGALARACGIPCVWVKTMDADWIRRFRTTGVPGNWRGHVFLEVFIRDRWMLLDATQLVLYEDYDPAARILPGNRYAYDKGADPYALVTSSRWELWKRQTRAYFGKFDLARLPVGPGRTLRSATTTGPATTARTGKRVYIAADSPVYQWIARRCAELGHTVGYSFNAEFDKYIPKAKGHHLIVTCVGDHLVLPDKYHDSHLPVRRSDLKELTKKEPHGILRRRLDDGTEVLLVFAGDLRAMRGAVDDLSLDQLPVRPGRDLHSANRDRRTTGSRPARTTARGKGVYIAADSPVYQWIGERCVDLGYDRGSSFNTKFDEYILRAKGNYLIVTCVGDHLVLPDKYHDSHLPVGPSELKALLKTTPHGILRRKLDDGTKVVLLFAKDRLAIRDAIGDLSLE